MGIRREKNRLQEAGYLLETSADMYSVEENCLAAGCCWEECLLYLVEVYLGKRYSVERLSAFFLALVGIPCFHRKGWVKLTVVGFLFPVTDHQLGKFDRCAAGSRFILRFLPSHDVLRPLNKHESIDVLSLSLSLSLLYDAPKYRSITIC